MFTLAAREGISIRAPVSFSRTALHLRPTGLLEVLQLQLLRLRSCRAFGCNRACLCPRVWHVRARNHFFNAHEWCAGKSVLTHVINTHRCKIKYIAVQHTLLLKHIVRKHLTLDPLFGSVRSHALRTHSGRRIRHVATVISRHRRTRRSSP